MKNLISVLPLIVLSLYMKKCGSDDLVTGVDLSGLQGTQVGQVAADFTLLNRYGEDVTLSEFRGMVILVDFATMWCAPCKEEAAAAEELFQTYNRLGYMAITVLFENNEGRPPTASNLTGWAESFGLTFPVLEDGEKETWELYNDTGGLPLNLIIDRDFIIRYKEPGYSENTIRAFIESSL